MAGNRLTLFSYWRSSSAYRVRIALNLKEADYRIEPVHLLRDGGEQHRPEFRRLNPLGVVPCLVDGDFVLSQSLAIFHYLEDRLPHVPLVAPGPELAARMWSLCSIIACDTQPLQNLSVFQYLERELAQDEARRDAWARHWIGRGLDAFEQTLADGPYCMGERPSFADCVLIPQLYNARRYGLDVAHWPRIAAVAAEAEALPAFASAHPDRQPDAPGAPGV
jgi:maleylacetoacetate isomerase